MSHVSFIPTDSDPTPEVFLAHHGYEWDYSPIGCCVDREPCAQCGAYRTEPSRGKPVDFTNARVVTLDSDEYAAIIETAIKYRQAQHKLTGGTWSDLVREELTDSVTGHYKSLVAAIDTLITAREKRH
jgi:hypothetical protein